ncbi:MAG: hypothetical protein H6559_02245 [Lewinellaceae bacterium]|nr:hypothetical protein [Lewinellaceae bacterium]
MAPLKYAIREASQIFKLIGGAALFTGEQANISNLRSVFENAKVIHFGLRRSKYSKAIW